MANLLNNPLVVGVLMSFFVFCATQGLKWLFVKQFTKNLEGKKKTAINSVILVIAICLAVGVEFLYSTLWLKTTVFSYYRIIGSWSGASGIFSFFELFVKLVKPDAKVENIFKTNEAENVLETAQQVLNDGKIDKQDGVIVADFLNELKNLK